MVKGEVEGGLGVKWLLEEGARSKKEELCAG